MLPLCSSSQIEKIFLMLFCRALSILPLAPCTDPRLLVPFSLGVYKSFLCPATLYHSLHDLRPEKSHPFYLSLNILCNFLLCFRLYILLLSSLLVFGFIEDRRYVFNLTFYLVWMISVMLHECVNICCYLYFNLARLLLFYEIVFPSLLIINSIFGLSYSII